MSLTDALTGIPNRRSILDLLEREVARTRRHGPPLCVALLDLDHFKKVNDTHGHPTGDKVLQEAARVLRDAIRSCDAIGRYGGKELMIVLPDSAPEGAALVLERPRRTCRHPHSRRDRQDVPHQRELWCRLQSEGHGP